MCLGVETAVSGCVVAPSEAEPTSKAYLASAPRLTFGAGGCQLARRRKREEPDRDRLVEEHWARPDMDTSTGLVPIYREGRA